MEIKSYKKPGYVSWSNSKSHSELLCCAPFEPNDSQIYSIDILSIDIAEKSKELDVLGSCYCPRPFRCIAWDTFGEKENTYPYGLIFGGMEDGSMSFWNPAECIHNNSFTASTVTAQNYDSQPCLIYEEEAQEGAFPIMCAEWNSLKPHYLAFGASDVLIVDIGKDISNPEVLKPGRKNPHEGSYITSVKWNKEVPHILASASSNGLIALWDIKSDNSIFQFKDSPNTANTTGRNVVICWSKNISTQIAVTLDDQKKNELQIWDLRNQKGPVVVIDQGHTKGINAMDWCETDPELILTGGHDSKALCWNYNQPDSAPISEVQAKEAIVEVKWSKRLPSIFSITTASSIDIYTLNETNLFSYVPKWYKVANGSTIFSSDTLLTYSSERGNVLNEYKLNLPRKQELSEALNKLALIVKGQEIEREDSDLWSVISAKNSKESDIDIFEFLKLSKSKIVKEVEKYTGKKRESGINHSHTENKKNKHNSFTPVSGSDAFSFFENIKNKSQPAKTQEEEEDQDNVKYDMVPRNHNWDTGKERIIKENILIGNYGGAIDAALKCGRTAEALIIAYSVGQETFNTTLKTFFTETTDSFITDTLKPLAYRDSEELVKKYDIDKWKECIALVFSIASEKRSPLLKSLANRIRNEKKDMEAVIVCLVLAEDFQQISDIYYEELNAMVNHSTARKETAIELTDKLIAIYESSTTQVEFNKTFRMIIRETAYVCIEQGREALAYELMKKYSNTRDAFMDYLSNLQGFHNVEYPKTVALPYMKRPEKVKADQNRPSNVKSGNLPPGRSSENPVRRPKPIFEKKNEPQVPDHQPPRPPVISHQPAAYSPYQEAEPEPVQPVQAKKTVKPPPPPPGAKKPPAPMMKQQQSEQDSSFCRESPPPPPPNRGRGPPPQVEKAPVHPPPPTPKKSAPLPPKFQQQPPKRQQAMQIHQEEPHEVVKSTMPPPRGGRKQPTPPPPRSEPEQQPRQTQWANPNQQQYGNNRPGNQPGNNPQQFYQNQYQINQPQNQSQNHPQNQFQNQFQNQPQNQGQWPSQQYHQGTNQFSQNQPNPAQQYEAPNEYRQEEPMPVVKKPPAPPGRKQAPPPPRR